MFCESKCVSKKQYNYLLEFWRFVFCIMILGLHFAAEFGFEVFHAGYLGVEFFFLLSGYFAGSFYMEKMEGEDFSKRIKAVFEYMICRWKRLYPLYFAGLAVMFLLRVVTERLNFGDMINLGKSCVAEIFMLQWTPFGHEVLIYTDWYIPAVFWGGIFLVFILALAGKWGGIVIAPVTGFFIYRYYFLLIGKIDVIASHHGILRGIAGMGIGIFIYFISRETGDIFKSFTKTALILGNIILVGIFIYSHLGHRSKWDFLIIGLFAFCIFILMNCPVQINNEKVKKLFYCMGKITYPIYIFQIPILYFISSFFHI